MKIILNQDISGLGEEGDIKDVADGYARNYLVPNKLAAVYSKASINQLESRRTAIEARKEEKRKQAMGLKEKLEADEMLISMPAGENGKLFGSVNNATIATELEKKGYSIEKKRIEIPDHTIRTTGNYAVKIKLYGQEEAKLRVVIERSEKTPGAAEKPAAAKAAAGKPAAPVGQPAAEQRASERPAAEEKPADEGRADEDGEKPEQE